VSGSMNESRGVGGGGGRCVLGDCASNLFAEVY